MKTLTIVVKNDSGTHTAWFKGKPQVFGRSCSIGEAVWYLIQKGTLVRVEEYYDLNALGRKLTKKERMKRRKKHAKLLHWWVSTKVC